MRLKEFTKSVEKSKLIFKGTLEVTQSNNGLGLLKKRRSVILLGDRNPFNVPLKTCPKKLPAFFNSSL